MSLIQVSNVSREFSATYILRDVSCSLEHNSRIGLIGSNGCGKSTLIKIMLGLLEPSEGRVTRAKKCVPSYLPQSLLLDQDIVMIDFIRASRPDFLALNQDLESLSASLRQSHDAATEELLNKRIEAYHDSGAYDFDNQIKYVLTSLSFPEESWHKPLNLFSGGEQTRVYLAAMLLSPHDILILDEPTNHLDIAMIAWLEKYLSTLDKPFLVVSHDRQFLDNTVNTIWKISNGHLSVTKGNYSSFKEADEIARAAAEKAAKAQEKWIAETEDFIARNMAGQKTKQAKSRLKALEKIERIEQPSAARHLKLNIETVSRSGNDVFVAQGLAFGFSQFAVLAKEADLHAHYRDRICIIGPNGCGKTTLLKLIMGRDYSLKGRFKTGASLSIGYYDQHQIDLDEKLTVKDTIWKMVPLEPVGYVLGWLARFGFRGDDVDKSVSILSGGEKSRLCLSVLVHKKPNLLILDEPTNHLDIEMTDSLLSALKDYHGTIIFVSHDRYFIDALANKYWVFNKRLSPDESEIFKTITETRDNLADALELAFSEPETVREKTQQTSKKKKINPYYLEQIQRQIEADLALKTELNEKLNQIHLKLADSATYTDLSLVSTLKAQMLEAEQGIAEATQRIHELEDQYLELACE